MRLSLQFLQGKGERKELFNLKGNKIDKNAK